MRILAKTSAALVLSAALVTAYGAASRETVPAAPATPVVQVAAPQVDSHAEACARFSWPNIPHECIGNAQPRAVRSVRNVEIQPRVPGPTGIVRF